MRKTTRKTGLGGTIIRAVWMGLARRGEGRRGRCKAMRHIGDASIMINSILWLGYSFRVGQLQRRKKAKLKDLRYKVNR